METKLTAALYHNVILTICEYYRKITTHVDWNNVFILIFMKLQYQNQPHINSMSLKYNVEFNDYLKSSYPKAPISGRKHKLISNKKINNTFQIRDESIGCVIIWNWYN